MIPREDDLPQDRPNYVDPPLENGSPGQGDDFDDPDEGGEPSGWSPLSETPPPALAAGPSVGSMVQGLKRRWMLALGIGLVLAAPAAVGAYVFLEPPFNAFAQIHISTVPPSLRDHKILMSEHRNEFLTYQRLQASHIRGRQVLNAALTLPEVKSLDLVKQQPDPLLWLEEQIRVEFQDTNEVMTIAMTGMDAQACKGIVDGVRDSYFKEVVKADKKRLDDRKLKLETLVEDSESNLRKKKDEYNQMADSMAANDPGYVSLKQQILMTSLMEKRRQFSTTEWNLKQAETRLKGLLEFQAKMVQPQPMDTPMKEPEPIALDDKLLAAAHDRDLPLKELSLILKAHENKLERCEKHLREGNRELAEARVKVKEARAKVETRKDEIKAGLLQAIKDENAAAASRPLALNAPANNGNGLIWTVEQARAEVAIQTQQGKDLKADVDFLTKETETLNRRSTDLERRRDDIRGDTTRLDSYKNELEALKVEMRAMELVRVSKFQDAGIGKRDTKRQWLGAIVLPIVVLVAVCFLVGWWESRARRINSADEVARGLGVRVVGAVPAFPRWGRKNEEAFEQTLMESIDGIRTMLLREASLNPIQVVMVTSAVSGEGKTTLASQLAGSLARAGRRTLLIDADLRRPSAHQLFELPLQPGLSEVLLDEAHIAEATLATEVDGLWMVPAGQCDREVIQALAKDRLDKVFEKLRQAYDFIVIDSHPVLSATDSQLVGQHADAVILAVMREVSQMPKVYAAYRRLESLHISVLGAVVNGLPEQAVFSGGCSAAVPALR